MRFRKAAKPMPHPFTDDQIRAKAYEIWQTQPERSSEANWQAAIAVLNNQRRLQPLVGFWCWTGLGEKKLWDFFQLLIVPLVLTVGGSILQARNSDREDRIAAEKNKQDILVSYLDQMDDLLQKGLRKTQVNSEIFIIA